MSACFGFDYSDYMGDFSSRSLIMNKLNNTSQTLSQDKKDILKERKLTPSVQCLIEQIKKGNIENVRFLLDCNVNPNNSYMAEYPIYIASKYNKADIVDLLLQNGAKLDRGFYSELYEAVRNKNPELAVLLIENGAKVNYQDSITTNTILYMTLKNKMYDIAQVLISKGARPDGRSIRYIQKKKLQYLIPQDGK